MTLEFGTGYIPDLPDIRDFTLTSLKEELPEQVLDAEIVLPPKVDNRKWCSPIANQGAQGSCTGHSAVALFEYMERKAKNRHVDGSPAFVYYNSRLNGGFSVLEDTGSYIRATIQAICEDGVAEEKRFPYDPRKWNVKPSEEVYRKALNFKGTKYLRVDDGTPNLIQRMKSLVNTGYAINFGFAVYECMRDITAQVPVLPYPAKTERQEGGHAVIIVGYDDDAPSRNRRDGNATKGAFLIQNSWGTAWGQKGFFYMPYKYFETGLALDVWTINSIEWFDTADFR